MLIDQSKFNIVKHVTISLGVATISASDQNENEILRRADTALYSAKNLGRNRVCNQSLTNKS